MDNPWRIELFGGLRLVQGDKVVSRFRSTKNGSLLAYLAFYPNKQTFRDAVIELFWPDAEIESARNNFRVALNSLRHQLEPPGVPMGAVLVADRVRIGLNPAVIGTDVAEFESALHKEELADDDETRAKHLQIAIELYQGDLLSGWVDDWIDPERTRLADQYLGALRRITRILVEKKDFDRAVEYAHRAIAADSLREQSHVNLMRLYVAMGRPTAALQQYKELTRVFREELGSAPSGPTRELAKQLAEGIERLPSRHDGIPLEEKKQSNKTQAREAPKSVVRVGNIPIQFNRFLGREKELDEITALLEPGSPNSLITITGIGGSGKTRIGIEAASRLRDAYAEHIWFVGLADITDANLMADAIAAAMRITPDPQQSIIDQVISALSDRPQLLVLDNFEQIAEDGAQVLQQILSNTSMLKALVTSQVTLGIPGEVDFSLFPLEAPSVDSNPRQLLEYDAAKLFVDRAQAARPDFQVTPRNVAAVAELCRRLEGIPLAIELAAAWAQMLTPTQMLERLSERFELLVNPRRASTSRHQTLRMAIDWSYNLLSPKLQEFFASLSVFHGGWTIAAAAEVSSVKVSEAMLNLSHLRNRSLLYSIETEEGMRFGMLESIREYAGDLLDESKARVWSAAHDKYYAELAKSMEPAITGSGSVHTLDAIELDSGNMRAVIARAESNQSNPCADEVAASIWRFWLMRGHVAEGRRAIASRFSARKSTDHSIRLYHGAGRLAAAQGDHVESRFMYREAIKMLGPDAGDDGNSRLILLADLAMSHREIGDSKALIETLKDRLALLDPLKSRCAIARTLDAVTFAEKELDNLDAAKGFGLKCLTARRELRDRIGEADALYILGEIHHAEGDVKQSQKLFAEASDVQASIEPESMIANAYLQLSGVANDRGDYPDAVSLIQEGLGMLGHSRGDLYALFLEELCDVQVNQNDINSFVIAWKELAACRLAEDSTTGMSELLGMLAEALIRSDRADLAVGAYSASAAAAGFVKEAESSRFATKLKANVPEKDFIALWKSGAKSSIDDIMAKSLPVLQF
ncbi:MAG: BTAD domain-containing putative transcriptional regulator [Chthonomonadales bacterium]